MTRDDDRLIDVAGRVSDGDSIDWNALEDGASNDGELALLRSLRIVSDVSDVHGAPDDESSRPFETSPSGHAKFLKTPVVWGDIELREKIGEGAFAEVYRVWDDRLERHLALKLFHEIEDEGRQDGPPSSRVVDEGRLMAKVRHPNVVAIHNAEERGGRAGIWMDYVAGRTIEQAVRQDGPMSAREAANVGLEVCRALAAVHRAGLVHRDVKADNVMRAEGGQIFLMDFGAGLDLSRRNAGKTRTGTPMYMAPEVFFGDKATPRSDLYGVGVLLYHIVTGSYPVRGATLSELRQRLENREARLLRDERPQLPDSFVAVVERALSWSPSGRYATAGEMAQALTAFLAGEQTVDTEDLPGVGRRWWMRPTAWLAGAAALTAAVVAAVLIPPGPDPGVPVPTNRYTIEAGVYRESDGGVERLDPGTRLAPGDRLFLEVEASRDLYFYVVNEDDRGRRFALFPVPGLDRSNPIPGGRPHRLPGRRNGLELTWKVDSVGDREHVVILASPEPVAEFEELIVGIPAATLPGDHAPAIPIPGDGEIALRGIGGMAGSSVRPNPTGREPLHEYARRLARDAEEVEGVWFRHIEFANPAGGP